MFQFLHSRRILSRYRLLFTSNKIRHIFAYKIFTYIFNTFPCSHICVSPFSFILKFSFFIYSHQLFAYCFLFRYIFPILPKYEIHIKKKTGKFNTKNSRMNLKYREPIYRCILKYMHRAYQVTDFRYTLSIWENLQHTNTFPYKRLYYKRNISSKQFNRWRSIQPKSFIMTTP